MPNITRGLLPLFAAGGAAAALSPEDAEAAIRPDIEDIITKAIEGQKWAGRSAGNLESPTAKAALEESTKYKGDAGYFTEHGLKWRNEHDGWTPEQIAEGYREIYNSSDTVVIPNVLGVNPSAKEALWNPHGGESWYMPIVPYKKGFKSITLYNPEASKVERLLKDKGYWEGGSTSSIFTPTLGERSKSIGSGTLSAVNSPSFKNTIRGLDTWRKNKMSVTGGGSMLPLFESGGAEGTGSAPEEPSTWDGFKRGLGLGTRSVLEGLGEVADTFLNQPINAVGRLFGYDLGLVNPGKGIADAMGLPVPATDLEKNMALWESGAASAVPLVMGGGAMAKMAASPVVRGVGRELSSTPKTDIVAGGLLSRFWGGD